MRVVKRQCAGRLQSGTRHFQACQPVERKVQAVDGGSGQPVGQFMTVIKS